MRVRIAALLAVVSLALGGCGSGTTPRPRTTPASSVGTTPPSVPTPAGSPKPDGSGVPADVPTTGPNLLSADEKPPIMPPAAREHTTDDAVAFARFFIQTIDWGFATTSGAYMRHYFQPSCIECTSHADGLDNTRSAKHHYLGGRFTTTEVVRVPAAGASEAEESSVVTFDLTSVEVVDADGKFQNADAARPGTRRQIWMAWHDDRWTVTDMRPVA
jgi:hypothetical protein